MEDVFKAIADPTRREILLLLAEYPNSINNIADRFQMSRPAVSKHLKILVDSELIRIEMDEHDGRQRNCYAQLEALNKVTAYINELETFWNSKLDGLAMHLKSKSKSNK